MRRKLVLDILILFFIVVFLASITNFASATNGQNEVNTNGNSVGSNNTVNNTVNNNTTTGNQSSQINTATGMLGDVDGSGTVNASDAARILIYAANMGVRFEAPTQQMLNVADINKDGVINASDAALVLIYAAKMGASTTGEVTWDEVLNEV
ncbi:MAG: dockerin type I repeat-containing protein [Clostridia bacterium]|nr:dockerin type I repeat-containing protein [Clostridia bacterium]